MHLDGHGNMEQELREFYARLVRFKVWIQENGWKLIQKIHVVLTD